MNGIFDGFSAISKVVLYGSRAMFTFKPGSDIDLVVYGDELDVRGLFEIEESLDALGLPYKIDLALFHHIQNQSLLDHIHRVGVCVFQR